MANAVVAQPSPRTAEAHGADQSRTASTIGLAVLLMAIVAGFAWLGVRRSIGLQDDVTVADALGDDWLMYRGMAESILDGGWTMPAVPGNYFRPAGFLYNYFVAAVFAGMGRNAVNVYIVQAVLLGVSVALTVIAFRRYLLPVSQFLLAVALAGGAYLDVFRTYTFRLLSENLALFLVACFWVVFMVAIRRRSWIAALGCGAIFGMCGLTRPHLVPAAPIFVLLFWLWPGGFSGRQTAAFLGGLAAALSFLVIRNYMITGQLSLVVVTGGMPARWFGHQDSVSAASAGPIATLVHRIQLVVVLYGKRVLYQLGFLSVMFPEYHVRPHWMLAWVGVGAFLLMKIRSLDPWEWAVILFAGGYLAPLIAVGGMESYGYRMLLPAIPMLTLLAVRAVDLMLRRRAGIAAS